MFNQASALPKIYPFYTAFGEQGEYIRKAKTVGELPHPMRRKALKVAAEKLNVEKIQFGVPIYRTLKLTRSELIKNKRQWLVHSGDQKRGMPRPLGRGGCQERMA